MMHIKHDYKIKRTLKKSSNILSLFTFEVCNDMIYPLSFFTTPEIHVILSRHSRDIEIVNRRCNRTMPSWRCNFSLHHSRHRGYARRAASLLASFIIAPCAKRIRRQSSMVTMKLGRAFPPRAYFFSDGV